MARTTQKCLRQMGMDHPSAIVHFLFSTLPLVQHFPVSLLVYISPKYFGIKFIGGIPCDHFIIASASPGGSHVGAQGDADPNGH